MIDFNNKINECKELLLNIYEIFRDFKYTNTLSNNVNKNELPEDFKISIFNELKKYRYKKSLELGYKPYLIFRPNVDYFEL